MTDVYRMTFEAELRSRDASGLGADAVTDLIERTLEELDALGYLPSVSTNGVGTVVNLTIEIDVQADDELDALALTIVAVKTALHAAHIGTERMVIPTNVRTTVAMLTAA